MSDCIRFENVTLRRRMQEEFSYDLKRTLFSIVERGFRPPTRRTVIRELSFAIGSGEKFGIVGPNGSGKSTLLKLVSGILRPTQGKVTTKGTIAPLIELGAGFDPELSVEDNVVYYGVLLGYSRARMIASVGRVLDFAELTEYRKIPVKALSSGMAARLGFAVATDVKPDILLLDEVFAVGDEAFRRKSSARMRELWDAEHAIVLVSHDLGSIGQQCERAMWLDGGELRAIGPAAEVVAQYAQSVARAARLAAAQRLSPVQGVGNVDDMLVDESSVAIRGWAAVPGADRTGTAVGIFIDGRFAQEAAYGDARPDVVRALRSEALGLAGFHGSCSLAGMEGGRHRLEAAVFDHVSGSFHPIGEPLEFELHEGQSRSEKSSASTVKLGL